MNLIDVFSVVINTLACLAFFVAIWQLLFHARQMHRDLEMHFVDQYWKIMESTSDKWRLSGFEIKTTSKEDIRAIYEYLQLCEDEIDLRMNARVTDSTWEFWARGIAATLNNANFRKVLDSLPKSSFPRLREMISSKNPDTYDPLKKPLVWRRFHGL